MLHLAWLNSFHQSGMKNLMDRAVIRFGRGKPGIEALGRFSKVDELPFDFVRRRLSIVVGDENGEHLLICKGAVEEMLEIATHVREGDKTLELDDARRAALQALAREYNEDGFRVLVLAMRELDAQRPADPLSVAATSATWWSPGLLTFLDPPKESAQPGDRRAARERRGGEGADRRQPGGHLRRSAARSGWNRGEPLLRARHRPDG